MKKLKHFILVVLALLMLLPFSITETDAASSYKDAVAFYETARDQFYHCEFADYDFYYATRSKAGKLSNKRYATIGWRITVSGNGKSMYNFCKQKCKYKIDFIV